MLDTEKLRQVREGKALSQADAASLAGFKSRQAWSKIESGDGTELTLATLNRIAVALGVKAKDLLK
jgi:transcriptional regulator with XRE-family HTH domain